MSSFPSLPRALTILVTGVLLASVKAHAAPGAYISFNETGGSVSSIAIDSLSFEMTANYTDSQLQMRIFDLYLGSGTIDVGNTYTGFSVQKNSETPVATPFNFTPWNSTLGGNATDGDMIVWIDLPFDLVTGDIFTLSGLGVSNGDLSNQITAPSAGAFEVSLISSNDGSSIASPVVTGLEVEAVAIPEPSTYAALCGALALAGAMGARRRR